MHFQKLDLYENLESQDLENVEEKIKKTNNELDMLNQLAEKDEELPDVMKQDSEQEVIDPDIHAEVNMPQEFEEKLEPPVNYTEEDQSALENNQVNRKDTENETELESIPARVLGDDAASSDHTEDLDPRSEFEKQK